MIIIISLSFIIFLNYILFISLTLLIENLIIRFLFAKDYIFFFAEASYSSIIKRHNNINATFTSITDVTCVFLNLMRFLICV